MIIAEGWPGWQPMTRLFRMRFAGVLVSALSLVGCDSQAPTPVLPVRGMVLDGGLFLGEFTLRKDDEPSREWQLSESQLNELHAWMKAHRADLRMVVATPPPPSFSVVTFDADGNRTQIDLFSANESWKRAVYVVVTRDRGRSDYVGQMSLAPKDVASLRHMLGGRT